MATLPTESVDSIVTDPPYGLSFMGKDWDHGVPGEAFWREALRVAKPGAHLLAFGGSRTYHRLACAIEDAGWEIRDCIMWVYGSGFPKSHDVSKAIDKNNGEVGRLHKFTEWMRTTGLSAKQINDATDTFMGSHYLTDKSQPAIPTRALWAKLRPLCGVVPAWVDELVDRIEAEREVVGQDTKARSTSGTSALPTLGGQTIYQSWDITAPATDAAKQWQGWGTALKPAYEPVIVARKPLVGTVAANVQQYGTGAINVDGCRVGKETRLNRSSGIPGAGRMRACNRVDRGDGKTLDGRNLANLITYAERSKDRAPQEVSGRWPANFIHDGSDEVVQGLGESARFFYTAKASKRDRDEGCKGMEPRLAGVMNMRSDNHAQATGNIFAPKSNHHPTVKPTDLMRYLCRLVTPPGGIVLDPFMGSGSTGKGATLEGFDFIGIEQNAEYLEIAKARIQYAIDQMSQKLFTSIR